jgi:hypothetical protein
MGRILSLLLGLLVVAGVAYYVIEHSLQASASGHSAPRRQLDNVREKAKDIEQDAQKRADDLLKKSE